MFLTDKTQLQVGPDKSLASLLEFAKTDFSDHQAITDEQELIIGPDESVVSSTGREPIEGMNGGTYIPPFVDIDGKRYPNPSCINIDEIDYDKESTWSKARGSYGFFEDWVNIPWRDLTEWNLSSGSENIETTGDWIKFTTGSVNGYANNTGRLAGTSGFMSFLVKKSVGDVVYIGESSTPSENAQYTFSTGETVDGTITAFKKAVKISNSLAWLVAEYSVVDDNTIIQMPNSGDEVYFKNVVGVADISFTPPFGQDGHSANDARAYNFDGWDKSISFTFKPQFDYDSSVGYRYMLYNGKGSSDRIHALYNPVNKLLEISIGGTVYSFGELSGDWNEGTANILTDSNFLQEQHTIGFSIDATVTSNNVVISLNGTVYTYSSDLTGSNFNGEMYLGTTDDPNERMFNGLISNFCVHPTGTILPVDQSKPFYNPNSLYNKTMEGKIEPFGNPFKSIIASAGGVVEEGENIDGKYIIFESGLKLMFGRVIGIYTTASNSAFPIPFDSDETFTVAGGMVPYTSVAYLLIWTQDKGTFKYMSDTEGVSNEIQWVAIGY